MMGSEGEAIGHYSGDSEESPAIEQEHRIVTFDDVNESIFRHMSDYQRTLLGRYCARSTYHELSASLGVSSTAVSHAIHGAEIALREGLVEKFGDDVNHLGEMFATRFKKEVFYRSLYGHVLGIGVKKGYVKDPGDCEFRTMRDLHMLDIEKARLLGKVDDHIDSLVEDFNGNAVGTPAHGNGKGSFKDLPEYEGALKALRELRKAVKRGEIKQNGPQ